jgi:hypothetical protein
MDRLFQTTDQHGHFRLNMEERPDLPQVVSGNTNTVSNPTGWFVGHFIRPADDPRATNSVEIKWHTHPKGDSKATWTKSIEATNLAILISGKFKFCFPEQDILLTQQGDYVLWPAGVFHRWQAEDESVILTIRWPSKEQGVVTADERQVRQLEKGRSMID